VIAIIGWAIALVVILAVRSLSNTIWICAGLVILALLLLPDFAFGAITARLRGPLQEPTTFAFLLVIPAGILVVAALMYSGLCLHLNRRPEGPEDHGLARTRSKAPAASTLVALSLCMLLLVAALLASYRFLIWDATDDSLGMFWLGMPILVALFSSALLVVLLPSRSKLAGLSHLLLVPVLIILARRAEGVDFRDLTEAHAERARQAIEAYYLREGQYPQDLSELTPRYALSLPGPVIIYGQSWCYQAGEDYYRLGYLDRDHWSSPILFGRVYSAGGHSPSREDVCQAAIDAYRADHPD
jgi:hypothetical protein